MLVWKAIEPPGSENPGHAATSGLVEPRRQNWVRLGSFCGETAFSIAPVRFSGFVWDTFFLAFPFFSVPSNAPRRRADCLGHNVSSDRCDSPSRASAVGRMWNGECGMRKGIGERAGAPSCTRWRLDSMTRPASWCDPSSCGKQSSPQVWSTWATRPSVQSHQASSPHVQGLYHGNLG